MRQEDKIAQQVSDYLKLQYPQVIYHFDTGSGGTKSIGMAVRDKRLNPHRGYPDLFVPVVKPATSTYTGLYHGLYIELKATTPYLKDGITLKKNKHLEEQNDIINRLKGEGYYACFCTGFEETKAIIDWYLTVGDKK